MISFFEKRSTFEWGKEQSENCFSLHSYVENLTLTYMQFRFFRQNYVKVLQ